MKLVPWRRKQEVVERGGYTVPLGWDAYQQLFTYNGNVYPYGLNQTLRGEKEEIGNDFQGLVRGAYKSNGIVMACMLVRQMIFSEARFQFREIRKGRPGNLFGTQDLTLLEQPGGSSSSETTGDLLSRAMVDADLAGNWFGLRDGDRIRRLRPDWVTIVMGSQYDAEDAVNQYDADVLGYLYHPGGMYADHDPIPFLREEIAHFAPMQDPEARFRGMSWVTGVVREIVSDSMATSHKVKFFENGATPNMVIKMPDSVRKEAVESWVEKFRASYEGVGNAYKSMVLGGGADVTTVGADFQQMDFKITQGAGETRIAAAARVHPVIVGLSEGLQGASLNAGNFALARRSFADGTMRPLWRNMAGSLSNIVKVPPGAELWYDDRDIAFLREDEKDAADIQGVKATTIRQLIEAGFTAASSIDAINSDDFSRLVHSGLVSVQLQPPGTQSAPSSNGSATPVIVP
jgi:hypothetical protein